MPDLFTLRSWRLNVFRLLFNLFQPPIVILLQQATRQTIIIEVALKIAPGPIFIILTVVAVILRNF